MIRKLLHNKKLVGGLGPAVLVSVAGRLMRQNRSRNISDNDRVATKGGNANSEFDLGGEVAVVLRGAKRWLRENHASDRMKEVLDQWLAEEKHRTQVIDVQAKPTRRQSNSS
jgi:hypothetical protein